MTQSKAVIKQSTIVYEERIYNELCILIRGFEALVFIPSTCFTV